MPTPRRDFHTPLEAGDHLPLEGPSVYQGLTPLNDSSTPNSPAIPPLRPAHEALLAKDGPALSPTSWVIQLEEDIGLPNATGRFQTWEANVKRSATSHKEYPVYLYITRPSQDAIRSGQATQRGATASTERVTTVLQWIENAAAHYCCYARLQGREVAYCYGLYTFDLPDWARIVRAMDSEKPIIGMIERGENMTLTAKQFGTITRSQLQLQSRFAECAPSFATPFENLLILNSTNASHIHFITTGFVVPEPIEVVKERHERQLKRYEAREGVSLMRRTGKSKARLLQLMQLLWQCQNPAETDWCPYLERFAKLLV